MDAIEQLVRAAQDGDEKRVARLLTDGVEPDARSAKHRTALDLAVWARQVGVVRLLLAAGADPEQSIGEYSEDMPLRCAVSQGMEGIVRVLLDAGAFPDGRRDRSRATPLMVAAFEGHTAIVQLLLDHGADIELIGRRKTVLEWAERGGNQDAIRLLGGSPRCEDTGDTGS